MARVKISQTQATHRDRSLDMTDSGGNDDRSTRNTAGTRALGFGTFFFGLGFLAAVFFASAFFATAFLIALGTGFRDRVAMLQVYQN